MNENMQGIPNLNFNGATNNPPIRTVEINNVSTAPVVGLEKTNLNNNVNVDEVVQEGLHQPNDVLSFLKPLPTLSNVDEIPRTTVILEREVNGEIVEIPVIIRRLLQPEIDREHDLCGRKNGAIDNSELSNRLIAKSLVSPNLFSTEVNAIYHASGHDVVDRMFWLAEKSKLGDVVVKFNGLMGSHTLREQAKN